MAGSTIRGECLCAVVAFEVQGPFPWLYQCHCSLCRKQGGSVSNTGLIVASDSFRWLRGEGEISTWQKDTGFRSHFCRHCGAPVPNPLRDTGYIWVPSGLLEDGELRIAVQLYLKSRAPWDMADPDGIGFDEAPEMRELIRLLHEGPSQRGPA